MEANKLTANELFGLIEQVELGKNPFNKWFEGGYFITQDILRKNKSHKKIAKEFINYHKEVEAVNHDIFFKEKNYERDFWYSLNHSVGNITTPAFEYMAIVSRGYIDKRKKTEESISDLKKYSIIPKIKDDVGINYEFNKKLYSAQDILIKRLSQGDLIIPNKLDSFLEKTLLEKNTKEIFMKKELGKIVSILSKTGKSFWDEDILSKKNNFYDYGSNSDIFEENNDVKDFFNKLYKVIKK